jgi:hypothetical protein
VFVPVTESCAGEGGVVIWLVICLFTVVVLSRSVLLNTLFSSVAGTDMTGVVGTTSFVDRKEEQSTFEKFYYNVINFRFMVLCIILQYI